MRKFKIKHQVLFIAVVIISSISISFQPPAKSSVKEKWADLFDGKTLKGWEQKNGTATYKVVDGTIVGTTDEGSKNSFLCTKKKYGDFELEFEVKVDLGLNSGVQIRSKTREKTVGDSYNETKGRVIGPQVEIVAGDDEPTTSGYIYGEGTGYGWLTPEESREPHKHFKDGKWNKFRIVADGPRIQTWINGHQISDLTDEKIHNEFPKGFIGLQVHGIKPGTGPFQVAWKNIRIREM